MAVLTAIVGVFSWNANSSIEESFRTIRQEQLTQMDIAESVDDAMSASLAAVEIMSRLRDSPASRRVQEKEAHAQIRTALTTLSTLIEQMDQTAQAYEKKGEKEDARAQRNKLELAQQLKQEVTHYEGHVNTFSELLTKQPQEAGAFLTTVLEPEMNQHLLLQMNRFQNVLFQDLAAEADSVYHHIRRGYTLAIVSTVLSFLIALVVAWRLALYIARPLQRLQEAADAMGQGHLDVPIDIRTGDEIEFLATSFRRMSVTLKKSQEELRTANDRLERRVNDRTAELLQTNDLLKKEVQDRQAAQERLKHSLAQVERSNNELQDFASVASHDLQEPLRKVQVFGERLKVKCAEALSEEGQDFLNRLLNATGRMQNLINDLLAYSRVTTKAQPLAAVNLPTIVKEVIGDLEIRLEQVQGKVEVQDLPTLNADALQMRQLFQNLIGNALKFRRADVPPVIRIRGEALPGRGGEPEVCQIKVEDNGIGFEEKYRDRIFKVFERLHGRDVYEGTGIGLAICRRIAERHGGTITAKSTPGQGSTFIITLPLHYVEKETAWTPITTPLLS